MPRGRPPRQKSVQEVGESEKLVKSEEKGSKKRSDKKHRAKLKESQSRQLPVGENDTASVDDKEGRTLETRKRGRPRKPDLEVEDSSLKCCPRCLLDLRVSSEDSPTVNLTEPVPAATMIPEEVQQVTTQEQSSSAEEQANPATLQLMGPFEIAANGKAKFVTSCAVDGPPEEIVLLWPPLPEEDLKQETPPPPPPAPEPNVVGSNQAPTVTMIPVQGQSMPQQRMDQYYGLLPTPTQVTFAAQAQQPVPNSPIQYGQLTLNPPPPIIVSHQQAQPQPAWSSQPSPQQPFYQTATWYRQPPPPQAVLVQQQQQPAPQQRYVQFQTPPPVNFPFPPPTLQLQPGQAPTMVPANGVFTVQHHFLNVLPPGQFQQ